MVLFTGFCVAQFSRVSVDGDMLRVYRDSGEMYDGYMRLQETFGTFENDIYLLVKSPEPDRSGGARDACANWRSTSSSIRMPSARMSPFSLRKPTADGGTRRRQCPRTCTSREEVATALTDLQQNDPMMRNLILADLSGVVMILFPDPELTKGTATPRHDRRAQGHWSAHYDSRQTSTSN